MARAGRKRGDIALKVAVGTLVVGILVFGTAIFVAPVRPDGGDGTPSPTDARTTDDKTDDKTGTKDGKGTALLTYLADDEKVAKLVSDMEDGKVPKQCDMLYDQMGANPEVTVTDPDDVSEAYRLVERIKVDPDTQAMPVTDSYHHVYFTLQDGTRVGWSFDGAGVIDRGRESLAVTGDDALWAHVIQLQQEQADGNGDTGNGDTDTGSGRRPDGSYEIVLDDQDEAVASCPRSAKPGDEVVIEIYDMTDVYPVVTVDKGKVDVEQKGMRFVFIMPDHSVNVKVYLSDYGIGGA